MKNADGLTGKKKPLHSKKQAVKKEPVQIIASEAHPVVLPKEQPRSSRIPQIRVKTFSRSMPDHDLEEEMTLEMLDEFPPLSEEDMDVQKKHTNHKDAIFTVNLEDGLPTVQEALNRMEFMLAQARRQGYSIVRLIHGYGSTGKGGAIRIGVRRELAIKKQKREIADFLPGEELDAFTIAKRHFLEEYAFLTCISEFGKYNQGITIVLLKK